MKFDFSDLVSSGLVKEKKYANGLQVFKYSRKVFHNALWNTDVRLLEARGIVLDESGEAVVHPFTKVFNHNENNAGANVTLDTQVVAPRKINGFLAACRFYNGELIVSTTGSLDSDFAVMARKHIEALEPEQLELLHISADPFTLLFEICDPSDPHIVDENYGAYLIGARNMLTGDMMQEEFLDFVAANIGYMRPEVFKGTFREVLLLTERCKHEGYMVRLQDTMQTTVMKLKSPHYLTKKFLMRMGQKKVDAMFDDKEVFLQGIDEEFYNVVHYITRWFDSERWKAKTDQERREVIEMYFHEIVYDAKKGEY